MIPELDEPIILLDCNWRSNVPWRQTIESSTNVVKKSTEKTTSRSTPNRSNAFRITVTVRVCHRPSWFIKAVPELEESRGKWLGLGLARLEPPSMIIWWSMYYGKQQIPDFLSSFYKVIRTTTISLSLAGTRKPAVLLLSKTMHWHAYTCHQDLKTSMSYKDVIG